MYKDYAIDGYNNSQISLVFARQFNTNYMTRIFELFSNSYENNSDDFLMTKRTAKTVANG